MTPSMPCGADDAIRIPGGRGAGIEARAALTGELAERVAEEALRDLHLLCSEVVNNSVLHGGVGEDGWIELVIAVRSGCVRVDVRDSGLNGTPTPREPDYDEGGGFGLFLVETMASRWGADRASEGLTVWFELDLD
jgi:anti-sigma regulatory factor (Ser/Thr protein kinase)